MNTKTKLVFLLFLALSILAAGCSPSAPVDNPPAQAEPTAYPGPGDVYPAPVVVEPVYNPYPGPSEGVTNYVEWAQAESALMAGQVTSIYQAASLHVTLVLKDGSILLAKEPAMDEVMKVIETCGDPCKAIEKVNE